MAGRQIFQRWAFGAMATAPQRQLRSHSSKRANDLAIDAIPSSSAAPPKKPRKVMKAKATLQLDEPFTSPKRKAALVGFIATTPVAGDRIVHSFPTLVSGKLIKRYKRFLADVQLDDDNDTVVTVHCPNTGPMVGLLDTPLAPVRLSVSDNVKRKYAHTLEFIQVTNDAAEQVWVGVHSASANRMVETALRNGWLPDVVGHRQITSIQAEVKHTKDSRVDFVVTTDDGVDTFVEVKSVTLAAPSESQRCAVFPDTVSIRASKHVQELGHLTKTNDRRRAAVVFLVQRGDCTSFEPSAFHDADFAAHCETAKAAGVAFHGYACALDSIEPHVKLLGVLSPPVKR